MKIPALISFGGEMDEPVLNRENRSFKKIFNSEAVC